MANFGASKGFGSGFGSSTFGSSLGTTGWGQSQPQNQLTIGAASTNAHNPDWFGDGSGTSIVEYKSTVGKDNSTHTSIYYQSLVHQPEYKKFSTEELRLQDYMDSRLFGENPNANRPKPNNGTKSFPFAEVKEKDLVANIIISYQSVMMMPQYRGNSQEELRMEDYRQGTIFQGDTSSLVGARTNSFGSFGTGPTSFGSTTGSGFGATTGFGASSNSSALGSTTGFGAKPTGFGSSVFGSGAMTTTSTGGFGSTATQAGTGFGQKAASGFGSTNTGFGSTGTGTGFGQTGSGFGTSSTGFGQTSTSGFGSTNTGFGQNKTGFGQTGTTGFGQTSTTGFGQTSSTGFGTSGTGFGQTSTSGFGASGTGFGQTANTGFGSTSTGFGQKKTGFGQTGSTGFGQASSTGFGGASTGFGGTANTGFGSTNTGFGGTSTAGFGGTNTGFGGTANTGFGSSTSGFGQTANTGFGSATSGFGQNTNTGFGQAKTGFGQTSTGFGTGFGQASGTGFGQTATTNFGQSSGTGFGVNLNANTQALGANGFSNNSSVANSLGVSVLLHSLNPDTASNPAQSAIPPIPSFSVSHPYGYIPLLENLKNDPGFTKNDDNKKPDITLEIKTKADSDSLQLINEETVVSKLRSGLRYSSGSELISISNPCSFPQLEADFKPELDSDPSEMFRSGSINPALIAQPLRYNVPLRYAAIRSSAMSITPNSTSESALDNSKNNAQSDKS